MTDAAQKAIQQIRTGNALVRYDSTGMTLDEKRMTQEYYWQQGYSQHIPRDYDPTNTTVTLTKPAPTK